MLPLRRVTKTFHKYVALFVFFLSGGGGEGKGGLASVIELNLIYKESKSKKKIFFFFFGGGGGVSEGVWWLC